MRRFGEQSYYPVEMVTQAVERGGLSPTFIAYAHAAYCTEKDFNLHYEPMQVACSYQGLRRTIAKRYFSGQLSFDAKIIIARFYRRAFDSDRFYESDIGTNITGDS
jgi:hypothetical protein